MGRKIHHENLSLHASYFDALECVLTGRRGISRGPEPRPTLIASEKGPMATARGLPQPLRGLINLHVLPAWPCLVCLKELCEAASEPSMHRHSPRPLGLTSLCPAGSIRHMWCLCDPSSELQPRGRPSAPHRRGEVGGWRPSLLPFDA